MLEGKDTFLKLSRDLAKKAQYRESLTTQPKEAVNGSKGTITIENYLGGLYFLTVDETLTKKDEICLIEAKHSSNNILPSADDIKDGLIKMALFTNLIEVKINNMLFKPKPILKLTSSIEFDEERLTIDQKSNLKNLRLEANEKNFSLEIKTI